MPRAPSLALCLFAAACSSAEDPSGGLDANTPELGVDAGPQPILDATALLDADAPDAPEDAGTLEPDATSADAGAPTLGFVEDVYPMFESVGCNTFACHGSMLAPGGVLVYLPDPATGYADMLERQSFREARVILRPGAPDESVLVTHGETTLVQFQVIDPAQAALVRAWVEEGAAFRRSAEPSDAGVADSGTEPSTCSVADGRRLPPLPGACLPRCARATWDAVIACRTAPDPATCQDQAMAADPTPTTLLATGDDQLPMGCRECVNWQTAACLAEFCPVESLAFHRCTNLQPGAACTTENNALFTCARAQPGFRACQQARDESCVAP